MRALLIAAVETSSGSAGFVFPLIILVALTLAGFWLWSLIEALSWPRSTWDAAGLSRVRWLLRILFLGAVGAVLYVASPRRALRESYAAIRWGG